MDSNILLFSCNGNIDFSKKVATHLNLDLGLCEINKFANYEIQINIKESVRNKTCYVIQSTSKTDYNTPNDNLMELFILIDALKRGSAKQVNVIMPYYAYSRQDRKDYSRAPISASIIARFLETLNINRIIVYDLHAGQIGGFFSNNVPLDNLYVEPYFIKYIRENYDINNIIIVSPDEGSYKRAIRISETLGCDCATIYKERKVSNKVDKMILFGNVKNKIAILVDDIIDTAGTACKAASVLYENSAEEVIMFACHGLLSNNAIKNINNSPFKKVIITNTVTLSDSIVNCDKIEVIDVSKLCAKVIYNIECGGSLSALYNQENPDYIN